MNKHDRNLLGVEQGGERESKPRRTDPGDEKVPSPTIKNHPGWHYTIYPLLSTILWMVFIETIKCALQNLKISLTIFFHLKLNKRIDEVILNPAESIPGVIFR